MARVQRWSPAGQVIPMGPRPSLRVVQQSSLPLPPDPEAALQDAGWDILAVGGPTYLPPHHLAGTARHHDGRQMTVEAATLGELYAALWRAAKAKEPVSK